MGLDRGKGVLRACVRGITDTVVTVHPSVRRDPGQRDRFLTSDKRLEMGRGERNSMRRHLVKFNKATSMMMMMHDERVNVLNFFSFSGTPLDLALGGSESFGRTMEVLLQRDDPTPNFFSTMAWHFLVVSVLACPVVVKYSFRADSLRRGPSWA
jgi:hypothetical protein